MSNKKSVINEAKIELEEIKKFATEEALKQLQKKIQPQLDEMVNKTLEEANISIEADDTKVTVDDDSINVDKDGNSIKVELSTTSSEVNADTNPSNLSDSKNSEDENSTEQNEINEEDIIFEIKSLNEEETPATDIVPNTLQKIVDKLNSIEKKLEGGTPDNTSAEGEVAIIDDNSTEPTTTDTTPIDNTTPNAEPAQQATQPMIKEEEYMENTEDFIKEMIDNLNKEEMDNNDQKDDSETIDFDDSDDNDTIEFDIEDGQSVTCNCDDDSDDNIIVLDDEKKGLDEDKFDFEDSLGDDDMNGLSVKKLTPTGDLEDINDDDDTVIVDINDSENSDDNEIDEMLGVSHTVSSKGQSSKFPVGTGKSSRINVEEIKAHYESKLDELKEENNSLKRNIQEYEESFVELRTSIDEMQTFNAKLALANKLFLNGGLSTDEKLSINESLDKASSIKEAEKIYQTIAKENNIIIKESKLSKVKSTTVNVAPSSKPLYEGEEAKILKKETERRQILAGIIKPQE